MIINIVSIIITTIILYRTRISSYESDLYLYNANKIYNKYGWFTLGSQCIINILTNIISCNSNFSEVVYVVLYTIIAWIVFLIIITFKQYLRIPMANVFGYFWYYTMLSHAFKQYECQPELKEAFDNEKYTSITIDIFDISCSLVTNDSTNELKYVKGDTNFIITSCENIIKACGKRDAFGELILFILSGIMSAFIAEYILSKNTCKNKQIL